jgi:hypothetical protein
MGDFMREILNPKISSVQSAVSPKLVRDAACYAFASEPADGSESRV